MPVFFIIAIAAGTLTVGSAATLRHNGAEALRWHSDTKQAQAIQAPAFDAAAYGSASECLTAAWRERAALSGCSGE